MRLLVICTALCTRLLTVLYEWRSTVMWCLLLLQDGVNTKEEPLYLRASRQNC